MKLHFIMWRVIDDIRYRRSDAAHLHCLLSRLILLYPGDCQTLDVKITFNSRSWASAASACPNPSGWSEPHSPASSFWLLCTLLGIVDHVARKPWVLVGRLVPYVVLKGSNLFGMPIH